MYNYNLDVSYNNLCDYQEVFFEAFGINSWDEEKISSKRLKLYKDLKQEKMFNDLFICICKSNPMFDEADTEWGLIRLFAYDTFHILHSSIKEYFINDKNMCDNIVLKIKKMEEII